MTDRDGRPRFVDPIDAARALSQRGKRDEPSPSGQRFDLASGRRIVSQMLDMLAPGAAIVLPSAGPTEPDEAPDTRARVLSLHAAGRRGGCGGPNFVCRRSPPG